MMSDLIRAKVFYLRVAEPVGLDFPPFAAEWMQYTENDQVPRRHPLHQWENVPWTSPTENPADSAFNVVALLLGVARGEGLSNPGLLYPTKEKNLAHNTAQFTDMRARIVATPLYATLDPPRDLDDLGRALSQMVAGHHTRTHLLGGASYLTHSLTGHAGRPKHMGKS